MRATYRRSIGGFDSARYVCSIQAVDWGYAASITHRSMCGIQAANKQYVASIAHSKMRAAYRRPSGSKWLRKHTASCASHTGDQQAVRGFDNTPQHMWHAGGRLVVRGSDNTPQHARSIQAGNGQYTASSRVGRARARAAYRAGHQRAASTARVVVQHRKPQLPVRGLERYHTYIVHTPAVRGFDSHIDRARMCAPYKWSAECAAGGIRAAGW